MSKNYSSGKMPKLSGKAKKAAAKKAAPKKMKKGK